MVCIMDANLKLKFRIIERYRTQTRFAIECGRNDNWISRIIQKRQFPTEQEKEQIRAKLEISPEKIDDYFVG
jgi:hypothetical protein